MNLKNIFITAIFVFVFTLNISITGKAADVSPVLSADNLNMQKYEKEALNHKKIVIKKQRRVDILNVKYSSKNKRIASVDAKGIVTAKKSGKTKINIKIKYKLGGKKHNTVLISKVSVSNHKHNFLPYTAICPTCTETGYMTYKCAGCNGEKKEYLPINPDAHSAISKKLITGKDGKKIEQTICQNCNKIIAQKLLP